MAAVILKNTPPSFAVDFNNIFAFFISYFEISFKLK